jgi:hypothetical protein
MVRALTRAQWLRVLARGFQVECVTPDKNWTQEQLEDCSTSWPRGTRAPRSTAAGGWTCSTPCLHADRRPPRLPVQRVRAERPADRYPLTEDGYIAVAANMFWNNWPSLTSLFMRINNFLTSISSEEHDPAILTHWAGVRFLLDSQRAKQHERRNSRCFKFVNGRTIRLAQRERLARAGVRPGRGGGNEQLETIQASMLEMVMPVLPHRLNDELAKGDRADRHPGHPRDAGRASRGGAGQAQTADTIEEQMEIVKRGKVAYLFERYTEEMLIQTLLLLARGGNLEVTRR